MKKIYLIYLALAFAFSANAQQISGRVGKVEQIGRTLPSNTFSTRDISCSVDPDTVGLAEFDDRTTGLANFGNIGGGYIFGVNNLGLPGATPGAIEVGQAFFILDPVAVQEVIYLFAAKDEVSAFPDSVYLEARIRRYVENGARGGMDSLPVSVSGPGTTLASKEFSLSSVDTVGWTVVSFDDYVVLDEDFVVSVEYADLYASGDTIGLVSNSPGDAEGNNSFLNLGPGYNWFEVNWLYGNEVEVDVVMFPVACEDYLSVGGPDFYAGMQLDNFPNPATETTTFNYALNSLRERVSIEVYDAQGRVIKTFTEGAKGPGTYFVNMNVSDLSAGNYYYSLLTDGQRLTKKLIIVD